MPKHQYTPDGGTRTSNTTQRKRKVYKGGGGAKMPSFVWMLTSVKMIDLNRLCGDHRILPQSMTNRSGYHATLEARRLA